MAKINFKVFQIPSGISRNSFKTVDVRESFANVIFNNAAGVRAYDLMQRIYKSEEAVELDENDVKLLLEIADNYCVIAFAAQLHTLLDIKNK